MSNLNKYSSTDWNFYSNNGALPGNYTYRVFAGDSVNGWNSTEQRNISINDAVYEMSDVTPNVSTLSVYRVFGNEYDSATFGSKDAGFLNTSDALINASAGGHNSQVFVHFFESVARPVNFYWKGYGENYSGYPVYFYAYNFTGSAWNLKGSGTDILSNTEKSVLSLTSDYFGAGNLVYIWVKSMARVIYIIPVTISNLAYTSLTTTSFTVTWNTNTDTYGKAAYSTASQTLWTGYGSYDNDDTCNPCATSTTPGTVTGDGFRTTHDIAITGLACGTPYYYRAMSCTDVAQTNCATSSEGTVTTSACVVSCPFIYSWNGTEYIFDSEAITAFGVVAENEGKQPSRLPNLKSVDGKYKLIVSEELDERSYIDSVELLKINHPDNVEVYAGFREEVIKGYPQLLNRDISFEAIVGLKSLYERVNEFSHENPSFTFKFYTIRDKIKPISVTEKGGNVSELMEIDGVFWGEERVLSDIPGVNVEDLNGDLILDTENISELYRSVEFVYPREVDGDIKLLIRFAETDMMMWGSRNVYFNILDMDVYDAERFVKYGLREASIKISVWDGKGWANEVVITDYPRDKFSDIVIPLDIYGISTENLKIRVVTPIGAFRIDGIYVDYSEEEEIEVVRENLVSVKKNGFPAKEQVENNDGNRMVLGKGDVVNLEFAEIGEKSDLDYTMFLNVKGYYLPEGSSGVYFIKDKEIVNRLYNEEGFSPRYWYLKWGIFPENY
jgi:hypothetical protein